MPSLADTLLVGARSRHPSHPDVSTSGGLGGVNAPMHDLDASVVLVARAESPVNVVAQRVTPRAFQSNRRRCS